MFLLCASLDANELVDCAVYGRDKTPGVAQQRVQTHGMAATASSGETCEVRDLVLLGRASLAVGLSGKTIVGTEALAHVARAYQNGGVSGVGALAGQFSVVIWNSTSRTVVAIRDPIGLKPLYCSSTARNIWLSDEADAFPGRTAFDQEFIATFIATGGSVVGRTIWSGVIPVPPGCALSWCDGRVRCERYWSAAEIRQRQEIETGQVARQFHDLFKRSVLASLEPCGRTWADLSGGLDTSSIVATAASYGQTVTERPLGGTITYTDSLGGDETKFVNAVVRKFDLPNECFADPWPWRNDGMPPPLTSQPSRDYPFYARDRQIATVLRNAGATSLLSGCGPDYYMPFSARHIADLMLSGRMREGGDQLVKWAQVRGQSVWTVLARDVLPLCAPRPVQLWCAGRRRPTPRWLRRSFVARYDFTEHWAEPTAGGRGATSQSLIANDLLRAAERLHHWRLLDGIEVRQPFLSRDIVEFCLQLPHVIRTDIAKSKPVLRAAMAGVLPREVLKRKCTKGTVLGPRICWSFKREQETLKKLLKTPVLADLGCVEPKEIARSIEAFAAGRGEIVTCLYTALSLETWLSRRLGQYAPHVE